MKSFNIYMIGLTLSFIACKEPYTPETTSINSNILVVEGFINAGSDSTIFKLSRTVILANKNVRNAETGAILSIETSANETKALVEKGNGVYVTPSLNFGLNKKYRLKIRTKNGKNYLSDFVDAIASPPIDSVNYVVKPEGLQLYVNTSDPTNKTHYYRWEYEESWIFFSHYYSFSIWRPIPEAVEERSQDEFIYKCWGNANSSTILLGSSLKLDKDIIHLKPLTDIVSSSEKLSEKYSILVKQYALNKESYEFWENLQKNTERLGSIFDVLPSQLTGNIRNVSNAAEPVIGYISAGTTQQKRIFIAKSNLPEWTVKPSGCSLPDTVLLKDSKRMFSDFAYIPLLPVESLPNVIIGHLASTRACVDCTVKGTVKRPIFWQ